MGPVLIVSYSYPPMNEPGAHRPFELARALARREATPIVLTPAHPHTPRGLDDVKPVGEGIRVVRTPGKLAASGGLTAGSRSGAARLARSLSHAVLVPDKAVLWLPKAARRGKELVGELGIRSVVSTSPWFTNHLVARSIARAQRIPWIADFRDFHKLHTTSAESGLRRALGGYFERTVLAECDRVTFVAETMRKAYVDRFPFVAEKSDVIYNGIPEVDPPSTGPASGGPLRILHVGNLYGTRRSPFPLLEALERLTEKGELRSRQVVVELAGEVTPEVRREVEARSPHVTVDFLGVIDKSACWSRMAEAHLLWLIVGREPAHRFTVPLKTFEYLAARRSILVSAPEDSEVFRVLEATDGVYSLADPQSNELLLRRLLSMYENGELDAPIVRDAGRLDELSAKRQMARFCDRIDSVEGRRR